MTNQESRKAARARRRAERQAERERRRRERESAGVAAVHTASPDDPRSTIVTMPTEELRRRRTFKALERTHTQLVTAREALVTSLFGAAPGTDEHDALTREVEAINDEIDDLRELSDELLRQVEPLALTNEELVELERLLNSAHTIANASSRAQALLGAAEKLLVAIDDALDD